MLTKEQVRAIWDEQAEAVVKAAGVTKDNWTQDTAGVITVNAIFVIYNKDTKAPDVSAMVEAAAYGSNSSARKQAYFGEKKQKATELASKYAAIAKVK